MRLGLRAGEAAAPTLEDIGWRAGEVMMHGRGRRAHVVDQEVQVWGSGRHRTWCPKTTVMLMAAADRRW